MALRQLHECLRDFRVRPLVNDRQLIKNPLQINSVIGSGVLDIGLFIADTWVTHFQICRRLVVDVLLATRIFYDVAQNSVKFQSVFRLCTVLPG